MTGTPGQMLDGGLQVHKCWIGQQLKQQGLPHTVAQYPELESVSVGLISIYYYYFYPGSKDPGG